VCSEDALRLAVAEEVSWIMVFRTLPGALIVSAPSLDPSVRNAAD